MASYLNPEPGKPYGSCSCGETIQTREAKKAHWDAVREATGGRSPGAAHAITTTNPTRPERIESELQDFAEGAISEFLENVGRLLDNNDDLTVEEIDEAVKRITTGDWADEWRDARKDFTR